MKNVVAWSVVIVCACALSAFAQNLNEQQPRVWTDINGRKANATLIAAEADSVTLNRSGRVFTIPLSSLSADDRLYVRKATGSPDNRPAEDNQSTAKYTVNTKRIGETLTAVKELRDKGVFSDDLAALGMTNFQEFHMLSLFGGSLNQGYGYIPGLLDMGLTEAFYLKNSGMRFDQGRAVTVLVLNTLIRRQDDKADSLPTEEALRAAINTVREQVVVLMKEGKRFEQALAMAVIVERNVYPAGAEAQIESTLSQKTTEGKIANQTHHFPHFIEELTGGNPVKIDNPNAFGVSVGLRSNGKGRNFEVPANSAATIFVPDGEYEIYFVYSTRPDALFQGDGLTLAKSGIVLQIVEVVGGNYNIRQVK